MKTYYTLLTFSGDFSRTGFAISIKKLFIQQYLITFNLRIKLTKSGTKKAADVTLLLNITLIIVFKVLL